MTTDQWVNRCLIVPTEHVSLARALCSGIALGDSGGGMFITALSATGNAPATHFISSGFIKSDFSTLLPFARFDAGGQPTSAPGQPDVIVALAKGAVTLAQINALLSAIDITEQDPFEAMARLGLRFVEVAL